MKLNQIFESVSKQTVNELDMDPHFLKRFKQRYEGQTNFPLLIRVRGRQDKRVGTYVVSADEAKKIHDTITDMMSFRMPDETKYGVKIHTFNFDLSKDSKNIIWLPNEDIRIQAMRDYISDNGRLYIRDEETDSVGDTIFAILRGNKVITMFYNRSHTASPEKHNVDKIVDAGSIAVLANMKQQKNNDWDYYTNNKSK